MKYFIWIWRIYFSVTIYVTCTKAFKGPSSYRARYVFLGHVTVNISTKQSNQICVYKAAQPTLKSFSICHRVLIISLTFSSLRASCWASVRRGCSGVWLNCSRHKSVICHSVSSVRCSSLCDLICHAKRRAPGEEVENLQTRTLFEACGGLDSGTFDLQTALRSRPRHQRPPLCAKLTFWLSNAFKQFEAGVA